jgi:hypothetical protein
MLIIYVLHTYIKDCLRRLSAIVQSHARGREEVFVMQAAEDGIGMDGMRFSAADGATWDRVLDMGERRIGNNRHPAHHSGRT